MASNYGDDQADEPMEFLNNEEDLAVGISSAADTEFDETIGHVEDIIMEDDFQELQQSFLEKYYQEFEDTEENKFIYTDIHREYVQLIEKFLNEELTKRLPSFSMDKFTQQILERKNELEGEIFEILLTFSDFMSFKEMFLDYKADKEGNCIDLSSGITVTSVSGPENNQGGLDLSLGGISCSGSQTIDLSNSVAMPNSLSVGGPSGDNLCISGGVIGNSGPHPCLDSVQMFDEEDVTGEDVLNHSDCMQHSHLDH